MPQSADDHALPEPPMPTWVKAFIAVAAVIAAIVVVILLSTGQHGPGQHLP